jgi:hypothetical protein
LNFNWLLQHPDWIYWAALPVLMLHQLEEYVWPGGFREWMNRAVLRSGDAQEPLSKKLSFVVNIPLAWILFGAVTFVKADALWFTLPVLSILFVNSWFHIVTSLVFNEYVPGAYTSIIFNLPLTIYAYSYLLITWQTEFSMVMTSIMAALVVHIFILALLRGRMKRLTIKATDSGRVPRPD